MRYLLVACIVTFIPTSLSLAFHENIPPCKAGELGYLATLLDDGRSYMFLSATDPPSSNSLICSIHPRQMVKTMALERNM